MSCLVGTLVLNGGEKVVITFDDGRKLKAIYIETYGYNHIFRLSNGNDWRNASSSCWRPAHMSNSTS